MNYTKTIDHIELNNFLGKWYVVAGRLTFLETGAHNAVEIYKWNDEEKRIDVEFTFRKDSYKGKLKSIPQKAWIKNKKTNAHLIVSPFWPLKFDYLIIAKGPKDQWIVVGVPNRKYLWLLAKDWKMPSEEIEEVLEKVEAAGYPINDIEIVPQKH